jgi:hypothetical protein
VKLKLLAVAFVLPLCCSLLAPCAFYFQQDFLLTNNKFFFTYMIPVVALCFPCAALNFYFLGNGKGWTLMSKVVGSAAGVAGLNDSKGTSCPG